MQVFQRVFISDSINRVGSRFTVNALVSAMLKEGPSGLPWLVGHDLHRPIGWSYANSVYLEPGLTRFAGYTVQPETEEEFQQVSHALQAYIATHIAEHQPEIDQINDLLSEYLHGSEMPFRTRECTVLIDDGLAVRAFPKLFSLRDEKGLIPLAVLTPIGPGVFVVGKLVVFAHHYLRRSLSRFNTLNTAFLERLQTLAYASDKSPLTIKVLLDPDMVGLASSYTEHEEQQYWRRGPKFQDDLVSISEGVTHIEANERERFFQGCSATQFWWQSRDNQHILEAEELRDMPQRIKGDTYYGCRYVHSIVEEDTGKITHFDGAIRGYTEEKMIKRLEVDINRTSRDADYTKLWRVDGTILLQDWKGLLFDYFRDNYHVGQYLGIIPEDDYVIPIAEEVAQEKSLEKYVPYSLKEGSGLRIALSIHPYDQEVEDKQRYVVALDTLTEGDNSTPGCESWIVELQKILRRNNHDIHIPDNLCLVSFKDLYVNLPLISHSRKGFPDNLYQTVEGIKQLVSALSRRDYDQVIAYSVGYPVNDGEVRISVLGHRTDLEAWFCSPLAIPPISEDSICSWAERVSTFLREKFPQSIDKPQIFEVLRQSGVLLINRRFIDKPFQFEYHLTDEGLGFELRIPESEEPMREAVGQGLISPGFSMIKTQSRCTKCGLSYADCNHSKLLDDDVAEEIFEATPLFPFWTDRPVW